MSESLRPAAPAGARQPVTDPGQVTASERRPATQGRHAHLEPNGPSERVERIALSGCWGWSGSRVGRRKAAAGLVAVCVLALGVAACSVKDAKAEASASASASASTAVARAEKGIADANASATASREAALTPDLKAKRDAALAEPAPTKPKQMNEDTPEGAAASVGYFLDLYRYAYMTGNTTELAAMSEDRCVFCKSVIDRANDLHKDGGWSDKWDQDITDIRYYKKLEGYNYNLVHVHINYGQMTWCHPGKNPETADPIQDQELKFGVQYVDGRWMIGEGEVISK